ncbi:MFS transporter [Nocardia cyriacigeorgica]|uniref:MFS transporter n=1 Tax=Nocardia cyriacigeorgica TaxID=135487 RepID=UPI001895628D|nr:MFS transporter [Nocardia cyriacigeorgica]MBF6082885.1 MFS transporter [Nocardia cyriacigeorgica]MBF6326645.1 MFS transporter [Nocardia cyriacigeorgica]
MTTTTTSGRLPDLVRAQRRILAVLVAAQILSGAGLAAGITVGALLAQDMLGSTGLAGLPSALFTIGSAAAAAAVGRISDRAGRRTGLALGYATGAVGSLGVVAAAIADNVALLFASFLVYGAGTATSLQARYAGADCAQPAHRARAISTVLVATTVGAVAGPNLVTLMSNLAESWGIPPLSGPFVLSGLAYALAGLVLWILLRPDPLHLARVRLESNTDDMTGTDTAAASATRTWTAPVVLAATVMVLTQLVMVAIMTMTPIHMQHHGHSVGAAGFVIAVHVAGMYLPSLLSGVLVDRFGAGVVGVAAAVTLVAAGVAAALAPPSSVVALALALGLLGLGWNLGLISGTTMLTDAVPLATRARTQGTVDLCIAIAGAGGGLGSGMIVAATDYPGLALLGAALSLAIVPALAIAARRHALPR